MGWLERTNMFLTGMPTAAWRTPGINPVNTVDPGAGAYPSSGLLPMTPRQQGLLGMAGALMEAGGPSLTPVSFGQALGRGMQQLGPIEQQAHASQTQNLLAQAQLQQAERKLRLQEAEMAGWQRAMGLPTTSTAAGGLESAPTPPAALPPPGTMQTSPAAPAAPTPQSIPIGYPGAPVEAPPAPAATPAALPRPPAGDLMAQFTPQQRAAMVALGPTEGRRYMADILKAQSAAQSPAGKLVADRANFVQQFGADSPQVRAMDEAIRLERNPPAKLTDEAGIRKEFTKLSQPFVDMQSAYNKLKSAATRSGAPAEVATVFSFMKMLDPGSVVREGEYATAENARGVPASIRNLFNRVKDGERLTPEQKQEFLNIGRQYYAQAEQEYRVIENDFRGLARNKGINPEDVLIDFRTGNEPSRGGGMQYPELNTEQNEIVRQAQAKAAAGGDIAAIMRIMTENGVDPSYLDR